MGDAVRGVIERVHMYIASNESDFRSKQFQINLE